MKYPNRYHGKLYTHILIFCALFWQKTVFAGLQITVTEAVQGGTIPVTNQLVTKIQANAVRRDIGSTMSLITFSDKPEQIQLFHQTKTFQRLMSESSSTNDDSETASPIAAGQTTFDGAPAALFCWTNGPEHGQIWAVPWDKYSKLPKGGSANQTHQGSFSIKPTVGSVFGTNYIVVGTEYLMVSPVAVPMTTGTNILESGFTNLSFTVSTKLISITETNFSSSEFEIPSDYTDATGQPQQPVQPNVDVLNNDLMNANRLEAFRKGYEQGKPVLIQPQWTIHPASWKQLSNSPASIGTNVAIHAW